MATTTANLGLTLPTPNVDSGWGSTLNTDFTLLDDLFTANGSGTSVGLQVGSGKVLNAGGTIVAGGTVILGSGDGTGTVAAPTIRGAARTGTNAIGPDLVVDAINGTGTGGSGKIIFRTAPASGSPGTTANTMASVFEMNAVGAIGVNGANYGTAGQVLLSGGSAAPTAWGAVNGSVINISGQAQGDIIYRGAAAWERLPAGTSGQVLSTRGSGANPIWGSGVTFATAQAVSGQPNATFTSIPSSAKYIEIHFADVKTVSSGGVAVRIGTSAGIVSTGYKSTSQSVYNDSGGGGNIRFAYSTTDYFVYIWSSSYSASGSMRLRNITGNVWVADHTFGSYSVGTPILISGGGVLTLSGALDRVQVLPATGNFDGGTVNISYQ